VIRFNGNTDGLSLVDDATLRANPIQHLRRRQH